jgi:chemotaxis protein histidine kinase CheA
MTSPVGVLDLFVLEASEYLEQLDGVLAKAGDAGPDGETVQRSARALRGSATMAKLPSFAELAAAVERAGRAMRDGVLAWEPALSGALVAAVDELKTLLRNARAWTPADDQRAATRTAELSRYAPKGPAAASAPSAVSGSNFLSSETANIAAGLELLLARSDDRDSARNVLARIRALRGVAGIKEVPLLADVMEAAEQGAKSFSLGETTLGPAVSALLQSAATLLRRIASSLRDGSSPPLTGPERDAFASALETYRSTGTSTERIVPISELFFTDGSPTLVTAAPNPPTSPAERFQLEVVSQGEHLRSLVADARRAPDDAARQRLRGELVRTLRSLGGLADSFGETEVASLVASHADVKTDESGLSALDALAAKLAQPRQVAETAARPSGERAAVMTPPETLTPQEREASPPTTPVMPMPQVREEPPPRAPEEPRLQTREEPIPQAREESPPPPKVTTVPPAPKAREEPKTALPPRSWVSSTSPTPIVTPAIRATPITPLYPPTGRRTPAEQLDSILDQGIAGFSALTAQPLAAPAAVAEQPPVPVELLVYRGRAAIERAIEIRDELRRTGGNADADSLEELFDLLDLALIG